MIIVSVFVHDIAHSVASYSPQKRKICLKSFTHFPVLIQWKSMVTKKVWLPAFFKISLFKISQFSFVFHGRKKVMQ